MSKSKVKYEYNEAYASIELAKLLDEIGFNLPVNFHYQKEDELFYSENLYPAPYYNYNSDSSKALGMLSAPSLSVARRWIEKNTIYRIIILPHIIDNNEMQYEFFFSYLDDANKIDYYHAYETTNDLDEAILKGCILACRLSQNSNE